MARAMDVRRPRDASAPRDVGGAHDAGVGLDATGGVDTEVPDLGSATDAEPGPADAGVADLGVGMDAGEGSDVGGAPDASTPSDAGSPGDAQALPDASAPDAGPHSGSDAGLVAMSDEFNQASVNLLTNNTTAWQILHPGRIFSAEISGGSLTVVAQNPPAGQSNWGWFQDDYGVLIYKPVTGNFAVSTRFRVVDDTDPNQRPTGSFNAGGFVLRSAAGTHSGDEDWIMYNMGSQGRTGYSREIKKTVASRSGLYLTPQPFTEQVLAACRLSDRFYFFRWDSGTSTWTPERFVPSVTERLAQRWPEIDETGATPMYFDHPTLPATIQVGLITHAYNTAGPNDTSRTRGEFRYVRFAASAPTTMGECTSQFTNP